MTVWDRIEWLSEQAFKTYAEQERLLELYYEVRLGEYEEEVWNDETFVFKFERR